MNGGDDERRIEQNTADNLSLSLNCSPLIDVLFRAHYNGHMEENDVLTLIAMETAEPKRKLIRSAGAVYVVLIALIIGTISLANLLYARWQIPRYVVQPPIYVLIAICGVYAYQKHYLSYRYTLTDRMFAIERIAGSGERTMVAISLYEITNIAPYERGNAQEGIRNASVLPRWRSVLILLEENGRESAYRISPSEEFLEQLNAQWRLHRPQKER